ncbi:molybdate ABC transporter substrate-binding protein [Lentzea sp. NPDC051838]|uniref:molybdate ABC transporter substrate-binding protein n=1 Tax=Lentzea sp. NPDC051838 TaxID=3154849 RepID=UPI003430C6EA
MKRLTLLLIAALAACSPAPEPEKPTITVYADSALTEAFTRIGQKFEALQGIRVKFVFGSSQSLRKQLEAGAVADVYASASQDSMHLMSKVFATNRLVIALPYSSPKIINTVGNLSPRAQNHPSFAMCVPEAPCGAAVKPWFEQAGFGENDKPQPKVLGQDSRDTLAKLTNGEVEAAIVYASDVKNTQLQGVPMRLARNEEPGPAYVKFPIAIVSGSSDAKKFYDHVFNDSAKTALTDAGFELP